MIRIILYIKLTYYDMHVDVRFIWVRRVYCRAYNLQKQENDLVKPVNRLRIKLIMS